MGIHSGVRVRGEGGVAMLERSAAVERVREYFAARRGLRGFGYLFAANLTAVGFLITFFLPPLRAQAPFLLLMTAVVFSALYGGLGAGLFSAGFGLALTNIFVVARYPYKIAHTAVTDIFGLTAFLIVAVLVSSLSAQRRRAEKRLRQSEQHFRLMIENTSDVITVLSGDGVITYESPSLERVLGYKPAELIGHSVFEYIHTDDVQDTRAVLQRSLASPGVTTPPLELRFRAKDGSWRTLEAIGKNLLHEEMVAGMLIHSRDISDRKELIREQEARMEAENARRRFHDLVEGLDAIVWEAEPRTGQITFVSRRAEEMLGYPLEAWFCGTEWLQHVFPEDRERVLEAVRRPPRESSSDCEYRAVTAAGRLLWLRLIVYAVRDEFGDVQQLRGLVVDVTERRQSEAALRVSERLAATGRLAATIAHEINNPMAAVMNLMYLLQNSPELEEKSRQYARMAQDELARMAHITRQMLGFYRDSSQAVAVSLTDLLDNVLALYERKIHGSGVTVERRYDAVPAIPVFPGEIRQVFSNLLLNALDAVTPQGRITVHVFASRDWQDPQRSGVRVVFADNGPGIRPEICRRLFEPFFTTKGQKGTGLGLWVSQGIVQKHHGSIRVYSARSPGRNGTAFSIFLPQQTGIAAGAGSAA